jgi:hypothetical protein
MQYEIEEIRQNIANLTARQQEWKENQTWQINDLRKRVDTGFRATSTLLGMIFGALCYIGYKLP